MEKIKIEIDDNRRFADVAFLLDNERFLQDIHDLRSILGFPLSESDYRHWTKQSKLVELSDDTFQELIIWFVKQPDCEYVEFTDKRPRVDHLTFLQHDYHQVFKKKFTVGVVIDYLSAFLCRRYKKNRNFQSVIRSALIRNIVQDADYETTMLRLFPHTLASNEDNEPDGQIFFEQPDYYGFAIYFLPNTPKSEIMKVLKRDMPEAQRLYNNLILDEREMNIETKDVITNIKRDRDWYWQYVDYKPKHKKGNIWVELAMREAKHIGRASEESYVHDNLSETMRKAIEQYMKRLQQPR